MNPRLDLLVIGGGTAGLVAAKTAAAFGAGVLLVERDRPGGDCLWTGCVPSKSLLAAAHAAAGARHAGGLGVHVSGVRVEFGEVMAHVSSAIATIAPTDSFDALLEAGVDTRHGEVVFTGPTTATVDGEPVRFRQALLATGAAPVLPPVPGLDEVVPLTSETVWDLDTLPARLLVLGGGSIGCELAQGFGRLGSAVTVVEAEQRLLLREDARAGALVQQALARDGVQVRLSSPASRIEPDGRAGGGIAHLADGGRVEFDRILVSVGRAPRTRHLGLDTAHVALDNRGFVMVDEHLRTSNPRIWAAGDVTGHPQFTHTAGVHGSVAASNAVLGLRRSAPLLLPRVTYTHPEVAAVGVSVEQAEQDSGLREVTWQHTAVDRAVTEGQTAGFSSLVLDRRGRVVGGVVVGPRAGETIGEITLAIAHGLRARDLAGVVHAYPTWNDGVWNASIGELRASLQAPATARVAQLLAVSRRRWLDLRGRSAP